MSSKAATTMRSHSRVSVLLRFCKDYSLHKFNLSRIRLTFPVFAVQMAHPSSNAKKRPRNRHAPDAAGEENERPYASNVVVMVTVVMGALMLCQWIHLYRAWNTPATD